MRGTIDENEKIPRFNNILTNQKLLEVAKKLMKNNSKIYRREAASYRSSF